MLQLLHMLDKWTSYLENGGQVDAAYTDFEKAFDKVPHKRLISKLSAYGINGILVNWIQDFLAGRQQKVRVNGNYSGWGLVTSGIPPGCFLGFRSWGGI
jgi:ribonuclease P/MRP protein subunit RPP40